MNTRDTSTKIRTLAQKGFASADSAPATAAIPIDRTRSAIDAFWARRGQTTPSDRPLSRTMRNAAAAKPIS